MKLSPISLIMLTLLAGCTDRAETQTVEVYFERWVPERQCWIGITEERSGFNYAEYAEQYDGCTELSAFQPYYTLSGTCELWWGCYDDFALSDPELLGDPDAPMESGETCWDVRITYTGCSD